MNRLARAVAIGAVLRLPLGEPASFVTVAQADNQRSLLDTPSAAMSADGRYVAFTSTVPLTPIDVNHQRDVYVLDRTDGRVTLESGPLEHDTGQGDNDHPGISADGRWLVYGAISKVVLRDRLRGVSRSLAEGRDPVISLDGGFVAFSSSATDLVTGPDANGAAEDVYLLEVASGMVRRVSVASDGTQPSSGSSVTPSVSADGRYVVFSSTAPFTAKRSRPVSQVYVRDTQLHTTTVIRAGWRPAISADGRYVAFVSAADNLTRGDRNNLPDVFLHDMQSGTTELISRGVKGTSGNGASVSPAISRNGRFIAFQSEAADLVCGTPCTDALEDINLLWDVFVFDRQSRTMTRLSTDPSVSWMEASVGPAMDGDGTVVAFSSRHPMDGWDKANDLDLFIVKTDGMLTALRDR